MTDPKLISLLSLGDDFLSLVDPEGILSGGTVIEFGHSAYGSGAMDWHMGIVFRHGDVLCMEGVFGGRSPLRVDSVFFPSKGGSNVFVPLKDSGPRSTFAGSLGSLSGLQLRLKRCLSSARGGGIVPPEFVSQFCRSLMLEEDALFWNVEGGGRKDDFRHRFRRFSARFSPSDSGVAAKAVFTAVAPLPEGRVTVGMDVDVYGLGSKKCTLSRNIGLGHSFEADCRVERKGVAYPSVKVAFDLDLRIPVFYWQERVQSKDKTLDERGKDVPRPVVVQSKDKTLDDRGKDIPRPVDDNALRPKASDEETVQVRPKKTRKR